MAIMLIIIIKKFKVILIKMAKIKIIIISINKAGVIADKAIIINLANIIIIAMDIIMIVVNSRYFMALVKVLFIQFIYLAILVSATFAFKN